MAIAQLQFGAHPYLATETITPAIAAKYLSSNASNRPLDTRWVSMLSNAMLRNEWAINGETLKFAQDGSLLDGQHRLHAIIRSGKPQEMMVIRSIAKSTFDTLDQGKKRTASDILALSGERNTTQLAAACRYILCIQNGGNFNSFTNVQIENVLGTHPSVRHWLSRFIAHKGTRITNSTAVSVVTLGAEIHGNDAGEYFMQKLATGDNLLRNDPILMLRERLNEGRRRREKMTAKIFSVLTIKAWNAYIEGRPVKLLRYWNEEAFPEIR